MGWGYIASTFFFVSLLIYTDSFSAPRPHVGKRNFQKAGSKPRPFNAKRPMHTGTPITVNADVARVSVVDRLQKVIAHSGLASRRTAEEMV